MPAALAFTLPAAALAWYAADGGSYDIVARQGEALIVWWVIGLGVALGLLPARASPGASWSRSQPWPAWRSGPA